MIRLSTPVDSGKLPFSFDFSDRILVLGSCIAESLGSRLSAAGFDTLVNPFGTLYNPCSVASALERLSTARAFSKEDCVRMGAGADLVCSFEHHTSFARKSEEEFLDGANKSLREASLFWQSCTALIIILGTAHVWEPTSESLRTRLKNGAVSNCLKRPSGEFTHRMLETSEVSARISEAISLSGGRKTVFMVSPIRQMAEGARSNTLTMARLHLGLEEALKKASEGHETLSACYFPCSEIVLDELRDYRFFAADLVHPSETAMDIVWERFADAAVDISLHNRMRENEKQSRRTSHIKILK